MSFIKKGGTALRRPFMIGLFLLGGFMKNQEKSFQSKVGFILASVGSAVGMANIWMFPYRVGQNGGASFLLIYLFFIIVFSNLGLSAEFAIGRFAQTGTLGSYELAFEDKGKKKFGSKIGFLPLLGSLGIATGYAIIAGWVLRTFFAALTGSLFKVDSQVFFNQATGQFGSLIWHFAIVIITLLTLFLGAKSIEKTNKLMMPIFFILFFLIAIRGSFLPNAKEGYRYLFVPDWSYLLKPMTWVNAMGQAFFSLSITGSGMIVYGTYLSKKEDILSVARYTALFDTMASLLSALVVIPASFAFGIEPSAGPPLMFITMPKILAQIPFGRLIAIFFFLSVVFAAISSLQNMYEVVLESVKNRFNLSRTKSLFLIGLITLAVGVFLEREPVVGSWMDVISIYIIPFSALLGAFSWFYMWDRSNFEKELNQGRNKPVKPIYFTLGRYLYVPIALVIFILGIVYGGIG